MRADAIKVKGNLGAGKEGLDSRGLFIFFSGNNELWKRNASHANSMAKKLEAGLRAFKEITITQKVDANGIFALFPPNIIPAVQQSGFFYVWNEKLSEVRLMCSWDTTEEDVSNFLLQVKLQLSKKM